MKCAKEIMLLYAVTDRAWTGKRKSVYTSGKGVKGRCNLRTASGKESG